jgi:hypothetical protein
MRGIVQIQGQFCRINLLIHVTAVSIQITIKNGVYLFN